MYNSAKQGGSIKVFVIVAVILALIALGVLYGVKRVAMNDGTPPMALPETSETDTDGDTGDSADSDNQSSEGDDDQVTDVNTDTNDGADTDSSASGQDDDGSTTGSVAGDDQSTVQDESAVDRSTDEASELPQTGPAETFAAISLGLVAASAVAYVRSLRHL